MGLRRSAVLTVGLVCLFGPVLLGPSYVLGQQGKEEAKEGVYVIKKGDTLWDLSEEYLKDPFLWPKLWQRNQYITNPHWIYPGNPIRFGPTEKVKAPPPKPPEMKPPAVVPPAVVPPEVVPPEARPPEEKPEIAMKPPVKEKPVEKVVPPVKPPAVALKPEVGIPRDERWPGFLTKEEFPGIGVVVDAQEGGRLIMAEGDIIYLAFKSEDPIDIGERFTIFRTSRILKHPHTGESLGRKITILGDCKVLGGQGALYSAQILKSYQTIERGDGIIPYRPRTGQ